MDEFRTKNFAAVFCSYCGLLSTGLSVSCGLVPLLTVAQLATGNNFTTRIISCISIFIVRVNCGLRLFFITVDPKFTRR